MPSFILWFSLFGIIYAYAGYPALIALLARLRPGRVGKGPVELGYSVLIAAHNEAARLPGKVRSLLAARGSRRLVEVLIGSDGSTDDPAKALAGLGDDRVRVVAFSDQRGKPSVLNDLMQQARGEVIVMMDARQEVDPGVFEALLPNFADPGVGVVSGELVFRSASNSTATAQGMDAYWRYEKFLRRQEAGFRSVPGATGAIYAFRRHLYRPIPASTLLDDVAIPLQIVRQGFRCIFESGAVVYDEPSRQLGQESARKRRTLAGNAQLVALFPWLLNPFQNPIWFEFISHKLVRLAVPFLAVAAFVANLVLARESFYAWVLAGQMAFYGLALAGGVLARVLGRGGVWALPYMFVSLNAVTLLALGDFAFGRTRVQWSRKSSVETPRGAQRPPQG